MDKIKKIIRHHFPGLHRLLSRFQNRGTLWLRINNRFRPESSKDKLGLLLSGFCDTGLFCVAPDLALSPKTVCSLHLYSPALKARFYVRGGTDDIYNVLPFREMDVHQAILGNLRSGDVFIDGGANIGYYTILGARIVGPAGSVMAIEAAESTAEHLAYNLKINKINNVTIVNKAIQDNPEIDSISLGIAKGNYGMATVVNTDKNSFSEKLNVGAITIDQVCNSYDRLRMIKLDVEGAERVALLGAKKTLARTDCVVIECNDLKTEICVLLSQYGFSIRELNFSTYVFGYRAAV